MEQVEPLVDVKALKERYDLPESWWYAQAEAHGCPSLKIGKYRRFRISEIEKWLEAKRTQ
jgi:hypothetical protein